MGTQEKLYILKFREIVQSRVKLHHQCQYCQARDHECQVFHMNIKICFRPLVLLEMISFEKILKTVTQKITIQCK